MTSSSGNFSSIHSFEIISILAFGFLISSSLFCYQKWRHRKYDVITINYIISLDFLSFRKLGLTCEKTSRESKYRRINWHCVWLANQKTLFTPTLIHPPDWESRKIFSKITLKPLMHTKTHKKRTIFLNRETIPYFIFFWNRETDIWGSWVWFFLLRRKFVIVEVVYMIHTEMSRLLWLIKYDSSEKWVICRTSPRTDPFGYMLFCSFGMNLLCTKRNEACDSSVFKDLDTGSPDSSTDVLSQMMSPRLAIS